MELADCMNSSRWPLRGQLQRFVTWLLLDTIRAVLTYANTKPLVQNFISRVFNRDGGQWTAAAVFSLLGFLSAVPLDIGRGQRNNAAVLGLLVFPVPPILTLMHISPIVHPIRQRKAM